MSEKYKVLDHERAYYMTLTVEGWVDVFTHNSHRMAVVDGWHALQTRAIGVGGKRVASLNGYPANGFQLPAKSGVYLVRIRTKDAARVFRVMRL